MRSFLLLPFLLLGCSDETISGYADPAAVYRLTEIDGEAFRPRATIAFRSRGRAEGDAPCNTWSADQSVPYPWFELGPIAVTRRACPELEAEGQFWILKDRGDVCGSIPEIDDNGQPIRPDDAQVPVSMWALACVGN